jgi:excisionase family DNA binding protein
MTDQPSTVSDGPKERHIEALWRAKQVAEYLQCAERTVWRRVRQDGLPVIRVGRKSYFRKDAIDSWLDTFRAAA